MMDFSGTAGASYTDEQKKQMRTSLAIRNWDVLLASSSRSNLNQSLSHDGRGPIAADAKQYAGPVGHGLPRPLPRRRIQQLG